LGRAFGLYSFVWFSIIQHARDFVCNGRRWLKKLILSDIFLFQLVGVPDDNICGYVPFVAG